MPKYVLIYLSCFFISLLPCNLSATETGQERELSLEAIYQQGRFQAAPAPMIHWLPDGTAYVIAEQSRDGAGTDLVLYDPESGASRMLVEAHQLIPEGRSTPLDVAGFSWSDDNSKLLIFTNTRRVWRYHTRGDYWVLNMNSGKLVQLGKGRPSSSLMFAKFSPDGGRVAYVSEHNIFVEHLNSGEIIQLTHDGGERFINGTFDWVYEEDWRCRDGFRWSPDGTQIAYWHSDTEGTGVFYMINNIDSIYSTLIPLPYPKAGTTNSSVRVGVVAAEGGTTSWFDIPGDPRNNYLIRMDYIPGTDELIIQQMNRLQNQNTLWLANATSMEVSVLLTETGDAWVEPNDHISWTTDGEFFTWMSERSGWRALYLVSRDGSQLVPVTTGEYDIVSIEHIDLHNEQVYYIASPDDFTQRYLFRSPLDGSGEATKVSPYDLKGQHSYQIAPGAKFAMHTYHNISTPPASSIVSLPDHTPLLVLEDNAGLKKRLGQHTLAEVEFFAVDIGEEVFDAWMIRPPGMVAGKQYPMIVYVYGEPAASTVQDRWGGRHDMFHQLLVQQGYIVVSIDNRGTRTPRGRDWRKCIYGQVGILATHDQAKAVRAITDMFPFVDNGRIGVWGWSGGGSMALNGLFRYPDIYKAGIAVAFVADQRLYNTVYQERYMGLPQGNPEGFRDGSPITHAAGLKGEVLLMHGTADDNVHYQNMEMLADELIRLGKTFDMMAYPMRAHGLRERDNTMYHVRKTMLRFWKQYLEPGPR